jgi:hypothetical protein
MKKLLVAIAVCLSLVAIQANATVSIGLDSSGLLQDNSATAIPGDANSMGLLVVDIGGLGAPTATIGNGVAITLGSTILGNYIVIASGDFTAPGTDGLLQLANGALVLAGNVATGKQIDLIWFPGLVGTSTATPASGTSWYGSFYGGLSGNGDPWTGPADGFAGKIQFLTAAVEGGNADSAGVASNPVGGPEPSAHMLVGTGLLGLLAIRRRRS